MLEQLKEMIKEVVDDGELFEIMAKGLKKFHESLTRAGFTEEQATMIVAGQGLGIKSN